MQVAVVGLGYVGLTMAVGLAYVGHFVYGVDVDEKRVQLCQRRMSPIREPHLQEIMFRVRGRLLFTDRVAEALADADVAVIAVGTPSQADGSADTKEVLAAGRAIAQNLREGRTSLVLVKSTVPVGAVSRLSNAMRDTLGERSAATRVLIASNPEFLREGSALFDWLYPARIVVGAEESTALDMARALYQPVLSQAFHPPEFLPRPPGYVPPAFVATDSANACLIKYAANAFLALKISFINEIAGLCERLGGDVTEVSRGIGLDPRIGPQFLQAGLGWGGSCLPKDTAALLAMAGEQRYAMPIIEAARAVNFCQRRLAVEKLEEVLGGVQGRVIGVLGVAFKPGTDDVRCAPAIDLVRMLAQLGASVRATDPLAVEAAKRLLGDVSVEFVDNPCALAEGADALILATEWPEYLHLHLQRVAASMRTRVLLDGRNAIDRAAAEAAGFTYLGIGRCGSSRRPALADSGACAEEAVGHG